MASSMKAISFNGKVFYIQKTVQKGHIVISCFDLIKLWRELLTREELVERFKEQNPLVCRTTNNKIIDLILDLDIYEETIQNILAVDKALKIVIKITANDVNFSYFFLLNEESPEMFHEEITKPFILMFHELRTRQDLLINVIEAKDREIQAYQLEGAVITRRHVATRKFEKKEFFNERLVELNNLTKLSCNLSAAICEPGNSDLYCNIQKAVRHAGDFKEETNVNDQQTNLNSDQCSEGKKKRIADSKTKIVKIPEKRERNIPMRKKVARKNVIL